MKSFYTLIILFFLSLTSLQAQDVHFTQFWASPLTLNPALTGNFDGTYRACAIYRSQWTRVPSPFKTISISYDHNFESPFDSRDAISGGLMLYNDVAGDAKLSSLSILASGAYHKTLGASSRLSLGIQAGLLQKGIHSEELVFADMFNGIDEFDQTSGDPLAAAKGFSNIDLSLGLNYGTIIPGTNNIVANVGFAALHLLTPEETFGGSEPGELPVRWSAHILSSIPIDAKWSINPKVLYLKQTSAQEVAIGADAGYLLDYPNFTGTAHLGATYRIGDAINPYIGMDYRNFKVGISYDITLSSLGKATKANAFEVSLCYIGLISRPPSVIVVPCIRF